MNVTDKITITQEDNMELMARYPDKYFELAIVDPPYGIGVNSMNYTKSGAIRTRDKAKAVRKDYRKKSEWDILPTEEYFKELFRLSQNQIIWGSNYFNLPVSKSFIVWDKRCQEHLGSGSIAIACHDLGFELTACELDKEYYDKAIERIGKHTAQQFLFEP